MRNFTLDNQAKTRQLFKCRGDLGCPKDSKGGLIIKIGKGRSIKYTMHD
jgi:hypothetical protein